MKRNNIFVWAYITFIGASIVLRLLLDYTFWRPIVFAITFSSIFFAVEDLFSLLYQTRKKSCDITEQFVMESRAKKEEVLSFFSIVEEKTIEYKGTKYDLSAIKEIVQPYKIETEELLNLINKLDEINSNDRKKEKRLKKISLLFAYLGFLFLFSSMIMADLIIMPALIQEIITVISFAIILTTQQINQIAIKRIEIESEESKKLLKKITMQSEGWLKAKDKLDALIERIGKNKTGEKDT